MYHIDIFPSECTYALTCMCFRPGLCMYNSVLHVCISFYMYVFPFICMSIGIYVSMHVFISFFISHLNSNIRLHSVLMQGYLDPHYFMTNRFTDKSDVYSFGVVLLEVVTGKLPIRGDKSIIKEVITALEGGEIDLVIKDIVDPNLRDYPVKAAKRIVEIALNCVQHEPDERPTMSEVVKELEALVQFTRTKP